MRSSRFGRWLKAILIAFSIGPFVGAGAWASSGRPLLAERSSLILPLVIGGEPTELVWIYPSADPREYLFESASLLAGVKPRLRDETYERLLERVRPPGVISAEDLRAVGLVPSYDEVNSQLTIEISPELKTAGVVDFQGKSAARPREIAPELASGYLNWRVAEELDAPFGEAARNSFRGDFSGALSLGQFVLESGAEYDESPRPRWLRQETRLVREDFERGTRFEMGDLALRATAFQVAGPQAGVSLARSWLGPSRSRLFRPYGETQILLRRPSRVEVLAGESAFAVVQAPAGPLELRHLPLATGSGEIKLRITDDLGTVETVALDARFFSDLLADGQSDFQVALGLPARFEIDGRRYENQLPVTTIFFQQGLKRKINFGMNYQSRGERHYAGVEAKRAFSFGTISGAFTGHTNESRETDGAALFALQVWPLDGLMAFGRSVYLGVGWRGPRFLALDPEDLAPQPQWSADLTLSQNLGMRNRMSATSRNDWYAEGIREPRHSYSLEFEHLFAGGARFGLGARAIQNEGELVAKEKTIFARFTMGLGPASQATIDYDSANQRVMGSFTAQGARVGGHLVSGLVQSQPGQGAAFVSHRYIGERFEISDDHQVFEADGQVGASYVGRLGLGGAIAFAGDRAAFGRRVTDAFAIVAAPSEISARGLKIAGSGGSGSATVDAWGPALLPSLTSGVAEDLIVDDTNVGEGISFTERFFRLRPGYKSGLKLEVEVLGIVTLIGDLVDHKGGRVVLASGEVLAVTSGGELKEEPTQFFTNASGRFVIEGLKPGRSYEIRLFDESGTRYKIEIDQDARGILRVGELVPL